MSWSIIEIAGYSEDDPEIIAGLEDADEFARLIDTLAAHREALGITQAEVAKRMQTTQSAVSRTEATGGNPTIRRLLSYARAVGMRLHLRASVVTQDGWMEADQIVTQLPVSGETADGTALSHSSANQPEKRAVA